MDEQHALTLVGMLREGLEHVMWKIDHEASRWPSDSSLRLNLVSIADDARRTLDRARTAQFGVSLLSQADQKSVVNQ
jgi:hypothetical protein